MNEYSLAISFIISVLALKVVAFILGYKIVKLGHDTLVRGVSGELDFGFSGSIIGAKLKSASPGAFFVLMGSAIILWGLTVEKPFSYDNVRTEKTSEPLIDTLLNKPPLYNFDK
ncbi:MAG: hypothetical protein P8M34_05555 [Saprospiraceae bacterium]|nr:hypothetical protein [Saprospiraceae bacterium]|tara:strand:- start:1786 stop:2127 length:342 start_codon:yes stop_codon:yes gene_type:complete